MRLCSFAYGAVQIYFIIINVSSSSSTEPFPFSFVSLLDRYRTDSLFRAFRELLGMANQSLVKLSGC